MDCIHTHTPLILKSAIGKTTDCEEWLYIYFNSHAMSVVASLLSVPSLPQWHPGSTLTDLENVPHVQSSSVARRMDTVYYFTAVLTCVKLTAKTEKAQPNTFSFTLPTVHLAPKNHNQPHERFFFSRWLLHSVCCMKSELSSSWSSQRRAKWPRYEHVYERPLFYSRYLTFILISPWNPCLCHTLIPSL